MKKVMKEERVKIARLITCQTNAKLGIMQKRIVKEKVSVKSVKNHFLI